MESYELQHEVDVVRDTWNTIGWHPPTGIAAMRRISGTTIDHPALAAWIDRLGLEALPLLTIRGAHRRMLTGELRNQIDRIWDAMEKVVAATG